MSWLLFAVVLVCGGAICLLESAVEQQRSVDLLARIWRLRWLPHRLRLGLVRHFECRLENRLWRSNFAEFCLGRQVQIELEGLAAIKAAAEAEAQRILAVGGQSLPWQYMMIRSSLARLDRLATKGMSIALQNEQAERLQAQEQERQALIKVQLDQLFLLRNREITTDE